MTRSGEFDQFARASALTYKMIYREPVRPLYTTLTIPVLLIAGTKDLSAPLTNYATPEAKGRRPGIRQAAQEAMGELRAARFVAFPDVGHVSHLEMSDRFKSELLAFLKS